MKRLFTLMLAVISTLIIAQSPESFNYQAVVRDANGNVLPNTQVTFQFDILSGSTSGALVYSEEHSATTNEYGLVNLKIGEGTVLAGDFSSIDWGANTYFLNIKLDQGGGFEDLGTQQFVSVPYALYAKTAGNVGGTTYTAGNGISITGNVIENTMPDQEVTITGTGTTTVSGTYPNFTISTDNSMNGDVTGTTTNNTVTKIQGQDVSINPPATGQVLKWNGTEWAPGDDNTTGGSGVDGVVDGASFSGTTSKTLTLSRSNGLNPITANFTDEVDDADADPTNEIQTLSKLGNTVSLSNGGGSFTDEVDDADADPVNEIQTLSKSGNTVTLSNGGGSFTDEVNDADADPSNELQVLNMSNDTLYLSNGGQVYLGNYANYWTRHGNDIYYNAGHVGVGTDAPGGPLVVKADTSLDPDSALFEVKNKNGQTIFAVYDGGVRVYVSEDTTYNKDNVRTHKMGFAVGGLVEEKITDAEYFRVTPDSVRVWIKDNDNRGGGFAVAGYSANKTTSDYFMNIYSGDSANIINPSEARVLWYPTKNAFLTGQVLVESPDSVGLNSWATGYESKSIGRYSQALGYKPRAYGNNSTAIGYYANSEGANSYAFGNYATAQDSGSYAIGSGAQARGLRSFAIGSTGVDSLGAPTNPAVALGDYSYAFGMGTFSWNQGSFSIGTQDTAMGPYSTAIGYRNFISLNGKFSVAMGAFNEVTERNSITLGSRCLNNSNGGVALGSLAKVTSSYGGVSIGWGTEASGPYSTAIGFKTKSIGFHSVAIGDNATAEGMTSFASNNSHAYGDYSAAIGYASQAYGATSAAIGGTARGKASKSFGVSTIARSYGEVVVGYNNDTTASTNTETWVDTDPIFIVGNGLSSRHNALTVLKNGNVGVNMTNPLYNLHVMGSSALSSLLISPKTSSNGNSELILSEDDDYSYGMSLVYDGNANQLQIKSKVNSTIYGPWLSIDRGSGNVGIGTTAPGSHKLYVKSSTGGVSGITGYFENTADNGLALAAINSNSSSSDNVLLVTQKGTGDIVSFDSYHGTTGWDREFRFTNTGDGRCDGSWIAGGADYAEFFPKADITVEYEAGDIIAMSPTKTYTVEGATNKNSKLIVGVYSSNPAIIGNSEAEKDPENSVLVGMVGVIKTKVNTENGPIKIGDYITISSTPKVGMKATKPSMVVGRAMDNYNGKGIGLINVLVEVDWYFNSEEGSLTSEQIKNTMQQQQKDINTLKAEIEQLKEILNAKAEK